MERSRSNGIILIIAGCVLAAVSAKADAIGLGGSPGFGWMQGLATFLGALGIISGAYLSKFDGRLLVAAGLLIAVSALAADRVGLGAGGFGCLQGIGLFLGLAIGSMGAYFIKKKP